VVRAIDKYFTSRGEYPPEGDGISLLAALRKDTRAWKVVERLPVAAVKDGQVVDGWGNPMVYRRSAGVNGLPLLISGGSDEDLETKDDNIRSDGR